jgi:tight adherence protein B
VDPAAAAAPDTFRVTPGRPTGLLIAAGALAAALFLGVLLAVLPLVGRSEVRRRLGQLDRFSMGRRAAVTMPDPAGNQMLKAALAVSERAVRKPGRRERMELALDRAGSSLRPAEWLLIRVGVLAASLLLAILILPWWLGVPVGLLGGWGATAMYMRMRAGRRTRKFADQLPDALQLVVGSLRSGFSLPQSIDALVREGADPVAGELGRALAETRLGGDLEDALERVGERNASQDMAWLVMAIRIQREVGGNLAELLSTVADTMVQRSRLRGEVKTLTAEGRLSAIIMGLLPLGLGGIMFMSSPEYIETLFQSATGWAMVIGSALMGVAGFAWLQKIIKIEV